MEGFEENIPAAEAQKDEHKSDLDPDAENSSEKRMEMADANTVADKALDNEGDTSNPVQVMMVNGSTA